MNSLCGSEIILFIIGFIMLARIFAIVLYVTLHSAIGRRSETASRSYFLGMRVTLVSFRPARNDYSCMKLGCDIRTYCSPEMLDSSRMGLEICRDAWRIYIGSRTSSTVNEFIRELACAYVTRGSMSRIGKFSFVPVEPNMPSK